MINSKANMLIQKIRVIRNLVQKRPILVVFDVTKLCNQRCPMCNIWKTESKDMTIKQIEKRVAYLQQFGVGYVFLQGGDPLLRKDIIEIVDVFINHGIRPTIITNGIRLTKKLAGEIAKRPCNLAISVDSFIPEKYHTLRGVNTLEKVKNNIIEVTRECKKHRGNWSITTTVTRMTELSDVKNLMDFAYENGLMYAVRPYITVEGKAGKKDDRLLYNDSDVLPVFDFMLAQSKKDNYLAYLIYKEHIKYIQGNSMPACDALSYSFVMKEDGSFAPCLEMQDIKIGMGGSLRKTKRHIRISFADATKRHRAFTIVRVRLGLYGEINGKLHSIFQNLLLKWPDMEVFYD